jgi:hypothetical protein
MRAVLRRNPRNLSVSPRKDRLMKKLGTSLVLVVLLLLGRAIGQEVRQEIHFPDMPGYRTLKVDMHMHTVFSDGLVWPTVRVDEAWRQGLDAIAITDHIEYQPHKADVPTQHARSHDLAAAQAKEKNLLYFRGSEITRDTPPGHFNGVFLKDQKALDTKEFVDAVKAAAEQGAFVFWNHQGWKGEEAGRWLDVHTKLFESKWLHGMEVCNGDSYYPSAHKWCLEKNLTLLGNSDIHEPDLLKRNTAAEHRTMTLVFAKERSVDSLKEALMAGRTVVWCKDQLIGRQEWLEPLFKASVEVKPPHQGSKDAVWVEIVNRCEADLQLERVGKVGPATIKLPALSSIVVKIGTAKPGEPQQLSYTVKNLLVAPGTGLKVTLPIAAAPAK